MKKKGSDKVTLATRVRSVMEWMMGGFTSRDIIVQSVQKWGVDERTAKRYIASAYIEFKNINQANLQERVNYHIETRMKLFRELKHKDEPMGANAAKRLLEDVAKLEGLYVEKHEIRTEEVHITLNI